VTGMVMLITDMACVNSCAKLHKFLGILAWLFAFVLGVY